MDDKATAMRLKQLNAAAFFLVMQRLRAEEKQVLIDAWPWLRAGYLATDLCRHYGPELQFLGVWPAVNTDNFTDLITTA